MCCQISVLYSCLPADPPLADQNFESGNQSVFRSARDAKERMLASQPDSVRSEPKTQNGHIRKTQSWRAFPEDWLLSGAADDRIPLTFFAAPENVDSIPESRCHRHISRSRPPHRNFATPQNGLPGAQIRPWRQHFTARRFPEVCAERKCAMTHDAPPPPRQREASPSPPSKCMAQSLLNSCPKIASAIRG